MNKADLRKKLISKRFLIESHYSKSKKIQEQTIEEIKKVKSKRFPDRLVVLSYFSKLPEVSTDKISVFIQDRGHTLALPVCSEEKIVPIVVIDLTEDLIKSKMDIMEPRYSFLNDPARTINPLEIDIVLVPGVGFDKNGNRIGYGKGYYDRFLLLCKNALTIGFCFEDQLVEFLPTEAHDQKVKVIITEKQIIRV